MLRKMERCHTCSQPYCNGNHSKEVWGAHLGHCENLAPTLPPPMHQNPEIYVDQMSQYNKLFNGTQTVHKIINPMNSDIAMSWETPSLHTQAPWSANPYDESNKINYDLYQDPVASFQDNSAGYWTNAGHNFHQESHGLSYNTTLPLASPKPLAGLPIETNEKNYRNKRWLSYVTQNVVRDLSQHGFCVLDGFLDLNVAKRINDEVTSMHGSQMFSAGRVVSPHVADIDRNKIRGDQVAWVTGQEPYCKYVGELITNVDLIIKEATKSQESSRLSNYDVQYRTKAMVACYPGAGTKYEKHVDNADSDGRCITAIYYTNKGWTEKDGGVLRVYPSDCKNAMANIDPLFNRMLFFYSDKTNPHEVLPANSIRHAITVWYFDHKERVEYLALRKQRRRLQQQQEQQQQQQQQHLVHMHPAAPFKMQQHQPGGRPSVS